jgi:hypothetical protein
MIHPYAGVKNEGNMSEKAKIKSSSKDFRVTPGEKIKLRE